MTAAAGCVVLPKYLFASGATYKLSPEDEAFLDNLQHAACLFFWEQASPVTGQVLDRARNNGNGERDARRMASIASTGFALTGLCIAVERGWLKRDAVRERVLNTLDWHLNKSQNVHGFFYHFTDIETGALFAGTELSSIDTALLLCGVLFVREYFYDDLKIHSLATQIYERVEWPWMLNGGETFSMGWHADKGFIEDRWNRYCELMMIYLQAIGSPTHPVAPAFWTHFPRTMMEYHGTHFIFGNGPLFTHQYSQAWYDFRGQRDAYANYFQNSVEATRAHKAFCLSMPKWYNEDYWGISASDYKDGYTAWGGPPAMGPIDGSVVPCAASGSLPFLPADCLHVLKSLRDKYGKLAWGRYGFVDAFHPAANWYDPDVLGIDQGIGLLMAENLRTELVWKTYMRSREAREAMGKVGFHRDGMA